MKYVIDEDVIKKNGMELEEFLLLLLIKTGVDVSRLSVEMENKQMLVKDILNGWRATPKWVDLVDKSLLDADKTIPDDKRLTQLADELRKLFPASKKAGTCHYYRGNTRDLVLRLQKFFKLYGNKYTDNQILAAAKNYVESFNGNYTYMRILKYFIWKSSIVKDDETALQGHVIESSDLADWIENKNITSDDWTVEAR